MPSIAAPGNPLGTLLGLPLISMPEASAERASGYGKAARGVVMMSVDLERRAPARTARGLTLSARRA